jgi:hypothetical protein
MSTHTFLISLSLAVLNLFALDKMDHDEAKPGPGSPRQTPHRPHYHVPGSQLGSGDAGETRTSPGDR